MSSKRNFLIAFLLMINFNSSILFSLEKEKSYDKDECLCTEQKIELSKKLKYFLWHGKRLKDPINKCTCNIDGMVGLYSNRVCDLIDQLKEINLQLPKILEEQAKKDSTKLKELDDDQKYTPLNCYKGDRKLRLILNGEKGMGKTLIANKVSELSGAEIISLDGSDLIQGTFGASREALENAIKKAIDLSESTKKVVVLFIDESQNIAKKDAGSHNKEPHEDVLIKLKTSLLKYENDPRLCFIVATNNYDQFDGPLKSRLNNYVVNVKLPSYKVMYKFFDIATREMGIALTEKEVKEIVDSISPTDLRGLYDAVSEASASIKKIARQENKELSQIDFEILKNELIAQLILQENSNKLSVDNKQNSDDWEWARKAAIAGGCVASAGAAAYIGGPYVAALIAKYGTVKAYLLAYTLLVKIFGPELAKGYAREYNVPIPKEIEN